MKKYIVIAILFCIYQPGYSQTIAWKPIIGLNMNFLHFEDLSANETPGLDAGILLNIQLRKKFSFETGLIYSRANSKITRPLLLSGLDIAEEKYHLNFIKMPAIIAIRQINKYPFSIGLGVVTKYSLPSYRSGHITYIREKYSESFSTDTKSGNKIGLGIQFQVNKEFQINKNRFSAELHLDNDLTQWQYPTSFFEPDSYYSFRSTDLSLMLAMIL